MNHTQLLNYLVDKYKLQSYLELGVQKTEQNFDRINCRTKIGVDPCFQYDTYGQELPSGHTKNIQGRTSDSFFASPNYAHYQFDLIFIDGLHHADQVQRDFENSLKCPNDNGFIVIHDCLPEKEETTHVPRDSKMWHGDVYKFVMGLSNCYQGIEFITLNSDNGCCIIWKDESIHRNQVPVRKDWATYLFCGHILMNTVSALELDEYLPKVKEPV